MWWQILSTPNAQLANSQVSIPNAKLQIPNESGAEREAPKARRCRGAMRPGRSVGSKNAPQAVRSAFAGIRHRRWVHPAADPDPRKSFGPPQRTRAARDTRRRCVFPPVRPRRRGADVPLARSTRTAGAVRQRRVRAGRDADSARRLRAVAFGGGGSGRKTARRRSVRRRRRFVPSARTTWLSKRSLTALRHDPSRSRIVSHRRKVVFPRVGSIRLRSASFGVTRRSLGAGGGAKPLT